LIPLAEASRICLAGKAGDASLHVFRMPRGVTKSFPSARDAATTRYERSVQHALQLASKRYDEIGVDVNAALERLKNGRHLPSLFVTLFRLAL